MSLVLPMVVAHSWCQVGGVWEGAGTLRTSLVSLTLIFSPTTGLLSLSVESVRSAPSWRLPPSAPCKFPFPKSTLAPPAMRSPLGTLWEGRQKAGNVCQDHSLTQQNPTHPNLLKPGLLAGRSNLLIQLFP